MNQIECKILWSSVHIFKDITFYVFKYNSSFYNHSNVYTEKDRWHVNPTNKYVHNEWMLKFLSDCHHFMFSNKQQLLYETDTYTTAQPSCVFTKNKIECKILCSSCHIFKDIIFYFLTNSFIIIASYSPKKIDGLKAQPTSMFRMINIKSAHIFTAHISK